MKLYKYKIYCQTDSKFEYVWKDEDEAAPTTCPTNTAHTCDLNSVAIDETVDPKFQVDSESAQLNRLKYAPKGWNYQAHFIELKLSTLSGNYSEDKTGTSVGFSSLKFFKADGTEITSGLQSDLDAYCVHTKLIWKPSHSIEIISGSIRTLTSITDDVRLWATCAPHIASASGGNKAFLQGGFNLKFLNAKEVVKTDGRSSKHIALDTTYESHKWEFDIKHPAGHKAEIQFLLEFYKE